MILQCTEAAGIITEVGSEVGNRLRVGDRVCLKVWSGGAAAEEIVALASDCMVLPPSMTFEQGSYQ